MHLDRIRIRIRIRIQCKDRNIDRKFNLIGGRE